MQAEVFPRTHANGWLKGEGQEVVKRVGIKVRETPTAAKFSPSAGLINRISMCTAPPSGHRNSGQPGPGVAWRGPGAEAWRGGLAGVGCRPGFQVWGWKGSDRLALLLRWPFSHHVSSSIQLKLFQNLPWVLTACESVCTFL